jgi:hypothetical protein
VSPHAAPDDRRPTAAIDFCWGSVCPRCGADLILYAATPGGATVSHFPDIFLAPPADAARGLAQEGCFWCGWVGAGWQFDPAPEDGG